MPVFSFVSMEHCNAKASLACCCYILNFLLLWRHEVAIDESDHCLRRWLGYGGIEVWLCRDGTCSSVCARELKYLWQVVTCGFNDCIGTHGVR